MGFWDDVGDFVSDVGEAVSDAADAVADVVEDVVNAVEEVVTDVVETVGNAVGDAVNAVGDLVGGIPVVGGILSRGFHWLGDAIAGVFELAAAVVKGVLGIVGGVLAGLIRIVGGGIGGLLAWDASVFLKGVGDIASSIGGGVVLILGKLVAVVQGVFFLQNERRRLNRGELALLRRVYRGSVAFYNVRVVEGFAGLFSVNSRPFTLGNTIYLKDRNPTAEPELLVHECGHVWQYQNLGARYTTDALYAQATAGDAYDWEAELAAGKTRWQDFNPEAAAEFLEDVFVNGRRTDVAGSGAGDFYDEDPIGTNVEFVFGGTDRTTLARDSVTYVRGAFAWRLSNLL